MPPPDPNEAPGKLPHSEVWEMRGTWSASFGGRPSPKTILLIFLGVVFCLLALRFYYHRWRQHQVQQLVQRHLVSQGATPGYWRGDLVQLSFGNQPLTKQQLAFLPQLPRLRRLVFLETPLELGSLEVLATVASLRELVFLDVSLGREDVASIGACRPLTYLQVTNAGLDDEFLEPLQQLRELTRLDLNRNPFGDAGLRHLHALGQLELLFLAETHVTDEGIEELQRQIPRLVVRR